MAAEGSLIRFSGWNNIMTSEYKVDLDIYNGPLDLLLYLIRREEVNICDIPIARITDQYLQYVEALQALDMNIVGDFLVMAATLMYIKSYMLLPRTETKDEEEVEDPRSSLVKQLLEYKRYKESTFALAARAAEWEKKCTRIHQELLMETPDKKDDALPLEGVSVWDLLQRFSQLMKQTLSDISTKVTYDDTPIHEYMNVVLERVRLHTSLSFTNLFVGIKERRQIIGFFLALLELVRLNRIKIEQVVNYEDIQISLHSPEGVLVDKN
ncbi:MAG: segregation/condensation protein A [Candidatus Brocadia sp.]|nr:segregation/condensation protein A [Candidatus Brocadia sp.]